MGFGVVAEGASLRVADADEDGGVPVEKFSPCLGGFVRGLRRRRCGGPPLSEGSGILKPSNLQEKASGSNSQK